MPTAPADLPASPTPRRSPFASLAERVAAADPDDIPREAMLLASLAELTAIRGYAKALALVAEQTGLSRLMLHRMRKADPAADAAIADAEELIALDVAETIRRTAADADLPARVRLDAAKAYLRVRPTPAAPQPSASASNRPRELAAPTPRTRRAEKPPRITDSPNSPDPPGGLTDQGVEATAPAVPTPSDSTSAPATSIGDRPPSARTPRHRRRGGKPSGRSP